MAQLNLFTLNLRFKSFVLNLCIHVSFLFCTEKWDVVWIGDHFSVFPLLPFEKQKKKKKDKHNDAVPVSNFVSRSICSPQFDAASIKTEQHSLQTEWKVVYGTLRNHHLVALRVELKRSKLCFIFRGYAISKKKKRKRKRFGFASLCYKYFFCFWTPIR